jgi:hypothetical protein
MPRNLVTLGMPGRILVGEGRARLVKELDVCSERLPGDIEDDIEQVKRGATVEAANVQRARKQLIN